MHDRIQLAGRDRLDPGIDREPDRLTVLRWLSDSVEKRERRPPRVADPDLSPGSTGQFRIVPTLQSIPGGVVDVAEPEQMRCERPVGVDAIPLASKLERADRQLQWLKPRFGGVVDLPPQPAKPFVGMRAECALDRLGFELKDRTDDRSERLRVVDAAGVDRDAQPPLTDCQHPAVAIGQTARLGVDLIGDEPLPHG